MATSKKRQKKSKINSKVKLKTKIKLKQIKSCGRGPSNKSKESKVRKMKRISQSGKSNPQEKKGFFARLFGK